MNQGLYEELITKLVNYKINELDKNTFYIKKTAIDKAETAQLLSQHIGKTIQQVLICLNFVKNLIFILRNWFVVHERFK